MKNNKGDVEVSALIRIMVNFNESDRKAFFKESVDLGAKFFARWTILSAGTLSLLIRLFSLSLVA